MTPRVEAGVHRPQHQLPESLSTLGSSWRRVDEFYATLEVASHRAAKLRLQSRSVEVGGWNENITTGTFEVLPKRVQAAPRIIVVRGMKGEMECYGIYQEDR